MNPNWSYSPETPNLGQIQRFLELCDLEIWQMTLKNNRAPLLGIIKLYASFYHHMWIQTGVTVWKQLSGVMTSVTLTFDLWPWPFAWTSLLSMVIISWWYDESNIVKKVSQTDRKTDRQTDRRTEQTDRQTDRQTDWTIHRAAWSQLKILLAKVTPLFGVTLDTLGKLWTAGSSAPVMTLNDYLLRNWW